MEHGYIAKSIKSYYLSHITVPALLILFVIFLQFQFRSLDVLFPERVSNGAAISGNNTYVEITLDEIYPAGYQMLSGNQILGNYYYSYYNNKCLYMVLPLDKSKAGEIYTNYKMFGKIEYMEESLNNISDKLSSDLNWTASSLAAASYPYIICDITAHTLLDRIIGLVLLLLLITSIFRLVYDIIAAFWIHLSPPGRALSKYGDSKELLALVEEELSTLPQLATEDMFITEHFFIEISIYGIAIVPIDQIVWIYKNSTIHSIFGRHIKISYTLHICAHKNFYFNCPKNIKSDIDGIIDYLAEANHDILVGFNEKNKALAKERTSKDPGFRSWIS